VIEPKLTNPDFVRRIESKIFLPWGQVLFQVDGVDYLHSNGWIHPITLDQKQGNLDWARHNRVVDFPIFAGLTHIQGQDQWHERDAPREQTLASIRALDQEARLIFGKDYAPSPSEHPAFHSTLVGSCRNLASGHTQLAVIQFSPPPPFMTGIHSIADYEFLPSPFAVTLEEFRAQRNLAYELPDGSEAVNLASGDGASHIRVPAPFYTWPKEGPLPLISNEAAQGLARIESDYEFDDAILFFAWF
jgi:hypothetical protein